MHNALMKLDARHLFLSINIYKLCVFTLDQILLTLVLESSFRGK